MGSGTGLMILVLSIVAILVIARGVTTVWLIEDAWAWWRQRAVSPVALAGPPPAPPPSYDPTDWITPDDYPAASIRAGEQGRVRIRWSVRGDGRVARCRVVESSGHAALDRAACHAIRRSGRYPPVPAGTPERIQSRAVVWKLPE